MVSSEQVPPVILLVEDMAILVQVYIKFLLAEVERFAIENAIATCNGSLSEAAKHLDINVSTIRRKRQGWLSQASRPAPIGGPGETGRSSQPR